MLTQIILATSLLKKSFGGNKYQCVQQTWSMQPLLPSPLPNSTSQCGTLHHVVKPPLPLAVGLWGHLGFHTVPILHSTIQSGAFLVKGSFAVVAHAG